MLLDLEIRITNNINTNKMKILKEGYKYELSNFENKDNKGQTIQFIEKVLKSQINEHTVKPTEFVTINDGTTNEEVIEMLIDRLSYLQNKFPCKENACAITHLQEANMWLYERTRKRINQNVEGKQVEHK